MQEKFGWCFIGAGKLAQKVAKQINKSGRHKIVSVFSRNLAGARAFAAKHGGMAFGNAEAAITADGVDGVYIVTPHNAHFKYAQLSLQLEKPVFLEKPFTVTYEDTAKLIALARSKNVYLAEAMWTWFSDCAHKVKKLIDEGEIGEITSAQASFCYFAADKSTRLLDPKRAGGALLDIGVYPITYMMRLFGYPDKIECVGKVEGGVDLYETTTLTFGKTVCECNSSLKSPIIKDNLHIKGTAGELKSEIFHRSGKVHGVGRNGRISIKEQCSYLHEFDVVADEIRAGLKESAMVPLDRTDAVMKVMQECMNQLGLVYNCE